MELEGPKVHERIGICHWREGKNMKNIRKIVRSKLESYGSAQLVRLFGEEAVPSLWLEAHPESRVDANVFLREMIESGQPFCAARLGNDEFEILRQWNRTQNSGKTRGIFEMLAVGDPWFSLVRSRYRIERAGLRPLNDEVKDRFSSLYTNALHQIDILGSWLKGENFFADYFAKPKSCPLFELEPYRSRYPWSQALARKRVLVIHPFEVSIRTQFLHKRAQIFDDPYVLPDFDLETLKPPQAHFSEISDAENWFSLFEDLVSQVMQRDFDLAIIGAGPFGLPLAAEVKKMGKQAVHLGGATQVLFGIMGRRWDSDDWVCGLQNENWVRPRADETPGHRATRRSPYW